MRTALFQIQNDTLTPVEISPFASEKQIQRLIERNLKPVFNFSFVASEFSTGDLHGGRIDTLALTQNHNPVIIEYKKVASSDLIKQCLFYLSWLKDHRGDFEIAARKALGDATLVNWSDIRVICLAPIYQKYDQHAVRELGGTIELWSYRRFDSNLLYLEEVYSKKHGDQLDTSISSTSKSITVFACKTPELTSSFHVDSVVRKDTELRSMLREAASQIEEIDSPSLANIFGVSANWFTQRVRKSAAISRPILQPKKLASGMELKGPDGRFRYALKDVLEFVDAFERFVFTREHMINNAINLVPTCHPKIANNDWVTATKSKEWPGVPKNYNAIRKQLGCPVAFTISSSGCGYSLLFDATILNQPHQGKETKGVEE